MTDLQPDSANAPNEPNAPNAPTPRRKFWRRKRFLIPVSLLALFFFAVYWAYFRPTPKLKISPETTVLTEPLTPDGKSVDYRRAFRERQAAWLGDPKENGFREIASALGPRALEQRFIAGRVRWEDFPTDEASAKWFAGYWTELCGALEIDPNAKPTFLERLPLEEFMRLEGIVGNETPENADAASDATSDAPEENPFEGTEFEALGTLATGRNAPGTVWRGGEELPARVSAADANDVFCRLTRDPWTRAEFPVAARWLDENADLYAVYERALDAPRFGAPHFVGDEPCAFIGMLLPDVQFCRTIARELAIRANFRIGEGDVDGALADRRSILKLARRLMENPNSCLVEQLVGIAVLGSGVGLRVAGNPDAFPTAEQLATAARDLDETFGDFDFAASCERSFEVEQTFLTASTAVDLFLGTPKAAKEIDDEPMFFRVPNGAILGLLRRAVDVNVFLTRLNDRFAEMRADGFEKAESSGRFEEAFGETRRPPFAAASPSRKTRSETLADIFAGLLIPAIGGAREASRRALCSIRFERLQLAVLRYVAENGTLPPAFTVDKDGKPLQSWRVLVLPYLGDEERELYSQIRLDEPWDSEHNRKFQTEAPEVFRCPSFEFGDEPGETTTGGTTYSVVVGERSLFDKSGVGKDLRELLKDANKEGVEQFLLVERSAPVCWTRPDGEIDEADAERFGINGREFGSDSFSALGVSTGAANAERAADATARGLGSRHNGGIEAATAGGDVRFVAETLDAAAARRLLFAEKLPDDANATDDATGDDAE